MRSIPDFPRNLGKFMKIYSSSLKINEKAWVFMISQGLMDLIHPPHVMCRPNPGYRDLLCSGEKPSQILTDTSSVHCLGWHLNGMDSVESDNFKCQFVVPRPCFGPVQQYYPCGTHFPAPAHGCIRISAKRAPAARQVAAAASGTPRTTRGRSRPPRHQGKARPSPSSGARWTSGRRTRKPCGRTAS